MASQIIEDARIQTLSESDELKRNGRFVLYVMERSARAERNHALEHGVQLANELSLPLWVFAPVSPSAPHRTARNLAFQVEGLRDVRDRLNQRGIPMWSEVADPDERALDLAEDAAALVVDRGYLAPE